MAAKLKLDEIRDFINSVIANSKESYFFRADGKSLFRKPVVCVQKGNSSEFNVLRKTIPCHLTPQEFWDKELGFKPNSLSVLSYSLPFDLETVAENSASEGCPPVSWFEAKQKCIKASEIITNKLQQFLQSQEIKSLRPESSKSYRMVKQENGRGLPTWSQRHVGYICGVGTFGLHGALITPMGSTHRLDSLLIAAEFDNYSPIAESPFADCLYLQKGICGVCAKRCPAGAIQIGEKRDIQKCHQQAYGTNAPKFEQILGEFVGGCALCNTRVPCSTKSPKKN